MATSQRKSQCVSHFS